MLLGCASSTGPNPGNSSSNNSSFGGSSQGSSPCASHALISACNSDLDNGCAWCSVTDECGTVPSDSTLCHSAHAGGQCVPTFQVMCGVVAAFKCPNGVYEQAYACPGAATCNNVEGYTSVRCGEDSASVFVALPDSQCDVPNSSACDPTQTKTLSCRQGVWTTIETCVSPRVCASSVTAAAHCQ